MQVGNMFPPVWAAGLMTGTVLDGHVDVALLYTDGESVTDFGAYTLHPYPEDLPPLLENTLRQALAWNFTGPEPAIFARAEQQLTQAQATAVKQLLQSQGMKSAQLEVVGFHGQSVLHRPPQPGKEGQTRQLGDGALLHRLLGCKVVYDFRSNDVACGGQGAPLAPIYHVALLRRIAAQGDAAVLNLGGVGNLTWWDGAEQVIAFDTGPANAPLNDWVRLHGLGKMDRDGALARAGRVDEQRVRQLLRHPYFSRPYPKSLDRFDFRAEMAHGLSPQDGAATLSAFVVEAVGKALQQLPHRPDRLVVCGGGRLNPTIMSMLVERLRIRALPAEKVGWRGDAVEAECFAFLAVRSLRGLPLSFPGTTGVPTPTTGGRIVG